MEVMTHNAGLRLDRPTIDPQEVRGLPESHSRGSLVDAKATADNSSDAISRFTRRLRPTQRGTPSVPGPGACTESSLWPTGTRASSANLSLCHLTALLSSTRMPAAVGRGHLTFPRAAPGHRRHQLRAGTRPDRGPLGTMALSPASWKPRGRRAQCPLPAAQGLLSEVPAVHTAAQELS